MAHITADDLSEYFPGADGQSDLRISVAINTAGRLVAKYAPPPDPETSDYIARAKDAELMIGEYLIATRTGIIAGSTSPFGSESYTGDEQVRRFIRETMGPFYGGGGRTSTMKSIYPRYPAKKPTWIILG